ncbi:MAG: winged helix-turn-helix domain-containing protein [Caulobacteraceae bacterium]
MVAAVEAADNHAVPEGARAAGARAVGRVDLAREAVMRLGPLEIDPARRRIAHDDGREEILEPRVMQVLVALAKTGGQIVSRDEILDACWHGVIVGEDALNRVIGKLRRLAAGLGAAVFEIETITKVGYRIVISSARGSRIETIAAPGARQPLALPARPSIAVLPFKNLSGEPDREYLADAISEDIVTALSRWRWFFVIARHSSFTYKNQEVDPVRVGQDLGVRYLLAGGVRTSGQRVRVTVQLIDARNGSNIWADKFDYQLVDVFALQDEVTERVAAAIEPAMLQGEALHIERKSLADFSALDCFYRGMWRFNQVTTASHDEALALFREAVRLDPELALGHVGVSRTLYGRMLQGESTDAQADLLASLAAARAAIRLDPREATAYFAAAGAELYLGEHATALDDARLALTLNPNFAYAHYRLGQVLIFAGQAGEAVSPIERGLSLSPCDPQLWLMLETLALAHYQNRDYAAAVEFARGAERAGGAAVSTVLVAALARLGRFEEAAAAMARMDASAPARRRTTPAPYALAAHREHIREGFRLGREALERGA